MTSTQPEPQSYEARMFGPEGHPEAMLSVRQAGIDALAAIRQYREEGDELGALSLHFWLRNQAEMNLMMGIGRLLGKGVSWGEIAGTLGMDESEALERWAGIGPVPS